MLQSGDKLGPYTLKRTLGRGAYGEVWLAERTSSILTTQVALKVALDAAANLDDIRNEAQIWLAASGHTNIVPVLEAEVYDGQIVIACEYVADGSLNDWLTRNDGKAPNVEAALSMVSGILAGLQHLHKAELIHRDLKPDNIMLQGSTPRLADFGQSRLLKSSGRSTGITGTPAYMAPEAFKGKYSAASDLWSAGVLLHELLVGTLPYPQSDVYALITAITDPTPAPLSDQIPSALRPVLAKALAKPVEDRFSSAADMAQALVAAMAAPAANRSAAAGKSTNNLPVEMTSFIGRDKEVADVKGLLKTTRLLTLTGSAGTGKTRLLLRVAADLIGEFPDGVWLAELAPILEPRLLVQSVATALNVREEPGKPLLQTVAQAIGNREMLLLLDNCEHVLDAAAILTDTLLKQCPNLKIMASSREALSTRGERTYWIPTMSLPTETVISGNSGIEVLLGSEAVRLFADRAVMLNADFGVTLGNGATIARLCRRLDGIPLAIELAAARVRSLSVEQIEARLDDRFRLLTGGVRSAVPRQQTLRALIDWSYELLTEPEKELLLRLSAFAGGWSLESAERACCGDGIDSADVLNLLTALVDKSLVVYDEQRGEVCYRLLETVRQYAGDRLLERGELDKWRALHRDYFLSLAEEASKYLVGPEQRRWLNLLEGYHDNLRQALTCCLEDPQETEKGLRMAAALHPFWLVRGHLSEGRERLKSLLALPSAHERTKSRAAALNAEGSLCSLQGDYAGAQALHEESLEIYREVGDLKGTGESLNYLGLVAFYQGDNVSSRTLFDESLQILTDLGDKHGIANSLMNLGNVAFKTGDISTARSLLTQCLTLRRELGHRQGIANALGNLGLVASNQGDFAAARGLYEECLIIFRELGFRQGTALSLSSLGNVAYNQGNHSAARELYLESLETRRELGDRKGIANSLLNLGSVAYSQSDFVSSRTLYQESLELFEELGDRQGVAICLNNLGNVARRLADTGHARSLSERSLKISRELEHRHGIAQALANLANVARDLGEYTEADGLYEESLQLQAELGDRVGIAETLDSMATLSVKELKWEVAAQLWGAAERLRAEIGSSVPADLIDQYRLDVAAGREALGDDQFAASWETGRAEPWKNAAALALQH